MTLDALFPVPYLQAKSFTLWEYREVATNQGFGKIETQSLTNSHTNEMRPRLYKKNADIACHHVGFFSYVSCIVAELELELKHKVYISYKL